VRQLVLTANCQQRSTDEGNESNDSTEAGRAVVGFTIIGADVDTIRRRTQCLLSDLCANEIRVIPSCLDS
jgi:hypothetical protein